MDKRTNGQTEGQKDGSILACAKTRQSNTVIINSWCSDDRLIKFQQFYSMALLTNAKKERIFGKYNFRQVALPTRVKRVNQRVKELEWRLDVLQTGYQTDKLTEGQKDGSILACAKTRQSNTVIINSWCSDDRLIKFQQFYSMALLTNAKKERIFGKYNFRQVALPTRVKRVNQRVKGLEWRLDVLQTGYQRARLHVIIDCLG